MMNDTKQRSTAGELCPTRTLHAGSYSLPPQNALIWLGRPRKTLRQGTVHMTAPLGNQANDTEAWVSRMLEPFRGRHEKHQERGEGPTMRAVNASPVVRMNCISVFGEHMSGLQ